MSATFPASRLYSLRCQSLLRELPTPLALDALVDDHGPWELEIGFGKGRYLLGRAAAEPDRRFAGIEMAGRYFRTAVERSSRRGLGNLVLLQGEALYLLATQIPPAFAEAVHVYFPDPWPKSRHWRRRLFDPATVDLVLSPLQDGGRLYFATDHQRYGAEVHQLLSEHPLIELERLRGPWPDGARTNYEAKFEREGRPVLRLVARFRAAGKASDLLHPRERDRALVGPAQSG